MADTSDPVVEVVPEPAPPAPKRASPVLPVLGGVFAAVIGFGLAQVVPNGWPLGDTTALQATLTAQADEIAALKVQLSAMTAPDASLPGRIAALEQAEPVPDLTPRIDALEQALAAGPAVGGNADLTQLRAELEALKSGGLPAADLSQVTAAMDAKLAEADAHLAALRAEADSIATKVAARAALGQVAAALETGAPYVTALDALPGDLPAVLTDHAQSGLPTLQSLRDSFPDAARLALEASLQANMGESWSERIGSFLRGQTGARSLTPREGTDPDAVLSRVEAALVQGDLTTVQTELNGLPPEGQAAMAPWRAAIDLRLQAAAAVQALLATVEG